MDPVEGDSTKTELRFLAYGVVYTVAVLWAAVFLGLAVRLFLWVAFAG